MTLTNKLKADYVELINNQLDHIPIASVEEFDLIKEALSNINNPIEGYSVPEALRERIFDVTDLLNSPEDYVESEQDYAEYQQIMRDRINAKVVELQSSSEEQKLAYIQAHQKRETAAAQYQKQIAGHPAPQPGSDAHTVSEREMFLQQQRQFEEEGGPRALVAAVPRARLVAAVPRAGLGAVQRFAAERLEARRRAAEPERLAAMNASLTLATEQEIRDAVDLSQGFYTINNLTGISAIALRFITTPNAYNALRENIFTVPDLLNRCNFPGLYSLVDPLVTQALHDGCYILTDFDSMLAADHVHFLRNPDFVQALRDGVFTTADLIPLNNRVIVQIIDPRCLQALRDRHTTLELLIGMTAQEISSANQTGEYPIPPQPSL